MKENEFFYLQRGDLLCAGSLLKVCEEDEADLYSLYDVTKAVRTEHGGYIEVKPLYLSPKALVRGADESYAKDDLEYLFEKKRLRVYNN
jgi:hypothetical protein